MMENSPQLSTEYETLFDTLGMLGNNSDGDKKDILTIIDREIGETNTTEIGGATSSLIENLETLENTPEVSPQSSFIINTPVSMQQSSELFSLSDSLEMLDKVSDSDFDDLRNYIDGETDVEMDEEINRVIDRSENSKSIENMPPIINTFQTNDISSDIEEARLEKSTLETSSPPKLTEKALIYEETGMCSSNFQIEDTNEKVNSKITQQQQRPSIICSIPLSRLTNLNLRAIASKNTTCTTKMNMKPVLKAESSKSSESLEEEVPIISKFSFNKENEIDFSSENIPTIKKLSKNDLKTFNKKLLVKVDIPSVDIEYNSSNIEANVTKTYDTDNSILNNLEVVSSNDDNFNIPKALKITPQSKKYDCSQKILLSISDKEVLPISIPEERLERSVCLSRNDNDKVNVPCENIESLSTPKALNTTKKQLPKKCGRPRKISLPATCEEKPEISVCMSRNQKTISSKWRGRSTKHTAASPVSHIREAANTEPKSTNSRMNLRRLNVLLENRDPCSPGRVLRSRRVCEVCGKSKVIKQKLINSSLKEIKGGKKRKHEKKVKNDNRKGVL